MKIKIFIIPFITLLLSGCWNYRELNKISIASAFAIEKKDDNFVITVQIMASKKEGGNGSNGESSSGTPIIVFKEKGKTFNEAFKKLTEVTAREIYIGHTSLLILDESIAKEGINKFIDFFVRNIESRKTFNVLLSKKDTGDVLKILTPIEDKATQDIIEGIENIKKNYGTITAVSFDELISNNLSTGIEMVIPVITIIGDKEEGITEDNLTSSEPKSNLKLNGFAVFKKNKLVGYLNDLESISLNIIKNKLHKSSVSFKCDKENYTSNDILYSKAKIKIKFDGDIPIVDIKIKGHAIQTEVNCKVNMETLEGRKKIQDGLNNKVKSMIEDTIEKVTKDLNSDIFGFGQHIYRYNYKKWEKIKDNWDEIFRNIKYNIDVNYELTKKGSALKTIAGE